MPTMMNSKTSELSVTSEPVLVVGAVPDQIVLSQPAVQRDGAAPQGLAGSGRRRTLSLKSTEVTATIMTSPGQVSHCNVMSPSNMHREPCCGARLHMSCPMRNPFHTL